MSTNKSAKPQEKSTKQEVEKAFQNGRLIGQIRSDLNTLEDLMQRFAVQETPYNLDTGLLADAQESIRAGLNSIREATE